MQNNGNKSVSKSNFEKVSRAKKQAITYLQKNRPVGVAVKTCGGHGFDRRAGQIGRRVINGSPLLRRFFGAVLLTR